MPPRHKKSKKNPAPTAASAAETRRDWLVGDLVVAKLRGHRPWPAQIQRPEDYGYEARPHKVFVTFFGTEETCFCTYNKVTPFTSAMRKSMAEQLQKLNTKPKLENAIREIFAADDELKVSMRSEAHSDDEKSEDEDEQPPEPSSKPPPRKRAKIAAQEEPVVREPLAHRLRKESSRPTRAGAAAAATAASPRKQEKVTYVESMAAHQVHKLPRKVRIKVSSQSSDSASLPDVDEGPAAATEKESSSPQSFKSEPLSPEKKSDSSSALSPETAAGGTDGSNNEDVHMEEAVADADSSHPEALTPDADVVKKGSEHPDSSKAVEGNSAKTEVHENVEAAKELIRAAKELTTQEAKKHTETGFATKDTDTEPKAVVPASSGGKRSDSVEYERKRDDGRDDEGDKRVEKALDVANESASQEVVSEKDRETEGDASPKIQTAALIQKVGDTEAQVEVPTPSEDTKRETESETEKVGAAKARDDVLVSSGETKTESEDETKKEGNAEDEVGVPSSSREEQSKTDEVLDVAKERARQEAEKDRETEIAAPSKTETEVVIKKVGDAEAKVEVAASSLDEQGTSTTTGATLDTAEERVVQDAEKESVSTVVRMEVDAPLKIEAEAEAAKDTDAEARVLPAAPSIDVHVEKLRKAVEGEQERLDVVEEPAVKEAEKASERTIAVIEVDAPPKTYDNVGPAASSVEADHETETNDDNTAVAMEVDAPSTIEVEVTSVKDVDTETKVELELSSVDEDPVENLSNSVKEDQDKGRTATETLDIAQELAVQGAEDSDRTVVEMEIDAPSKTEPETTLVKETDAEAKVKVEVAAVDKDHLAKGINAVDEADRIAAGGQKLETASPRQSAEAEGRITHARAENSKVVTSTQSVDQMSEPRPRAEAEDKNSVDSALADEKINHDSSTATGMEEKTNIRTNEVKEDHARTTEEKTESGGCRPADAAGGRSVEASNEDKAEPLHIDSTDRSAAEGRKDDSAGESTVVTKEPQEAHEKESLRGDTTARIQGGDLHVDTRISEGLVRDVEDPAGNTVEAKNDSNSRTAVVYDVKDVSSQENIEKSRDRNLPATVEDTSVVDTEHEKMDTANADSIGDAVEVIAKETETTVGPPQEGKADQVTVGPIETVKGTDTTRQVKDGDEKVETTPVEKSIETETDAKDVPNNIHQVVEKDLEKKEGKEGITVDVTMEDISDQVPEDHLEKPSDVKVEDVGKDKLVAEVPESNQTQIPRDDRPSAAPAAS
ncbi:hypothetical protein R1sor_014595 [Riccia sorocarpa]|uniref:PWWP domain-containing protein n=1 Tax=Riccia sorocarpa TaxID=122646 RepID=A0ABD3HE28_9MARC